MNPGNIAKVDYLMSDALDCPEPAAGCSSRYLICSTARCGSNLVCDLLAQTRMAGVPMEYLNPRYVAGYLRSQGLDSSASLNLEAYLGVLERRRTTANGYFGIKVHFDHLRSLGLRTALAHRDFLQKFNHIIVLRRRDKVAQAVSLYRARVTQIWSSGDRQFLATDDPRLSLDVAFDPTAIARALADSVQGEQDWLDLLVASRLPFSEFWYEDFAGFAQMPDGLLSALGLPPELAPQTPSISRQSSADDPMLRRFMAVIGLPSS